MMPNGDGNPELLGRVRCEMDTIKFYLEYKEKSDDRKCYYFTGSRKKQAIFFLYGIIFVVIPIFFFFFFFFMIRFVHILKSRFFFCKNNNKFLRHFLREKKKKNMAVSSRETAISKNTLISLLQAIQGERTTVELRHENSVEGRIVSVDGYMNVELADVVYRSITGRLTRFEQFFIQGQHIRYVHIPDQINMLEAIQHNVTRKQRYLADMAKTMARNYAIKAARREQEWRRREKMEQQKGS